MEDLAANGAGMVGGLALVALAIAAAEHLAASHTFTVSRKAFGTSALAAAERAAALRADAIGTLGHVGLLHSGPARPREVVASLGLAP
jgi:hypothetical protein